MRTSSASAISIGSRSLLAALLSVVLTACAGEPAKDKGPILQRPHGNDCVFFSTVYDWKALDDDHLVIWAPGRKDAYLVELGSPLLGLHFAESVGFVDGNRDGRLCGYGRDAVLLGGHSIPQKSTIFGLTRLTPEEIVQLEARFKVKLMDDNGRKAIPKAPDRSTAQ